MYDQGPEAGLPIGGRRHRVVSAPRSVRRSCSGSPEANRCRPSPAALGGATSTITREVAANGGPRHYGAWKAHCRAETSSRRPKAAKLAHPPLVRQVTTWLEELWSPQEIAERLRLEFPDDPMMQVSHETIYQSLFVQGRGELRRELARCLRSGARPAVTRAGCRREARIPDMVMISERPAEVEDRAVPGHWEGDLIIGAGGKSAVGTLVERSTRFVLLLHLPDDHGATSVEAAMRKAIRKPARRARPLHHLGPGHRDGRPRELHRGHRRPDLLLRSPFALAAGIEREHQRPAAPIHAQGHRPLACTARGTWPRSSGASTDVLARRSDT